MAQPIEHRDTQSVMNAYDYFDKPNFAVFHVKDMRAYYDGGNKEQGSGKLQEWLDMIEASNTGAVYTLKVYDETCRDIKNNTPHSGSTTFMLSSTTPVKTENGVTIIDRTQGAANAGGNAAVMARMDSLEKTNIELREKLHSEQLKGLETRFQNQIAGLQKDQAEKPDVWTRIGDTIAEKPERLDHLIDKLGDFLGYMGKGLFGGNKNFIQQPAGGNPVQGTKVKIVKKETPAPVQEQQPGAAAAEEHEQEEDLEQEEGLELSITAEGALVNPLLTPEQAAMKSGPRFDLLEAAIKQLTPEQMDEYQMGCVELLENRLTKVMVTHLLMAVACLDNDDMNKLLNNMR